MPCSVCEVEAVIRTGTSSPALAEPVKFTVTLRRVRPRSSDASVRLEPSTSTSSRKPDALRVSLRSHALYDVHEPLDALALDLVGHLISHRRRLGAAARRVDERERAVEADLLDRRTGLFEIAVRLAGKADDEVGRERKVGDRRAELVDESEVALSPIRAPHALEDAGGARLQRQVSVLADGVALGHRGDDGRPEVLRVRARETDAVDPVDVVHGTQELAELRANVGQ